MLCQLWHVEGIKLALMSQDSFVQFRLPFQASKGVQHAAISATNHMPANVVQLHSTCLEIPAPPACSRQSTQRGTKYWSTGWCFQYEYSATQCLVLLSLQACLMLLLQLSTASEALDPDL
jgi:hypothetical protein